MSSVDEGEGSEERPPIGPIARIVSAGLGAVILGYCLLVTWILIEEREYFWTPLPLLVGVGGSAVFLHSAWVGTSPRWEDFPD